MLAKSAVTSGLPRTPEVAGSMAGQFSAMNSFQAKTARVGMSVLGPPATSCGTSGLMRLGGRTVWAETDCTVANIAGNKTDRRRQAIADSLSIVTPVASRAGKSQSCFNQSLSNSYE